MKYIAGYKMTDHAKQRSKERMVFPHQIKKAIRSGCKARKEDCVVFWGHKVKVVTDPARKQIITVIRTRAA